MIATTIRQGELLLQAGLDPMTADMFHRNNGDLKAMWECLVAVPSNPAWSLDALTEVMCFNEKVSVSFYRAVNFSWVCRWTLLGETERLDLHRMGHDRIEAAFEVVFELLRNGLIKRVENG